MSRVDTASLVAGVDEVGRGPLAGPVVAAAVILPAQQGIDGLADSKRLTHARRQRLDEQIRQHAVCYAIACASVEEIDQMNILQASLLAMQRAVAGLSKQPMRVLVDGNCLPRLPYDAQAVVGGDALVDCISAASIIAKVYRDRLMSDLHECYPQYGFASNKGYPSRQHRDALQQYGACPVHRRSFAPVRAVIDTAADLRR
jgi:ribonuclease HII